MSRFVLTAQLQLQAPNNVAQVVSQIQSQLNNVSVNVQVQGSAQANQQLQQITRSTQAATTAAGRMGNAFAVSIRRFAAFSIATRAVGLFTSTLADAVKTAIDFERELIKISQVTGRSVSSLRDLTDSVTNLSTGLGVTSQSLLEVTTVLTQAGLSSDDTKIALESLAKAALAPNFDSIQETAEGAIAILAQFKQGVGALEGQLSSIDAVAGAFAVEAGDLIDVIRRSGGVFKASGGSLNELLALFTSVRATTRESAESIGTGLRTIFTRIQRPETIEFLKQFGVELVDLNGKFVGPYEAIKRLSEAISGLGEGDLTFIKIAEELGGFRQIGKVLPLLQQFSTAQAALNVAQNAGNGLTKNAETAQASLAIRIIKVKEEFLALVRSMTETTTFQVMANTALALASALIKIADSIKPLLPLLGAVAAFKAVKGIGGFLGGVGAGLTSGRTFHSGGRVHAFATGGLVPGTGNSDTVPAMLTPGEFVIRKSSVAKLGAENLAHMNRGGLVQKFALGGIAKDNIVGMAIPDTITKEPYSPISGKASTSLSDVLNTKTGFGVLASKSINDLYRSSSSKKFIAGKLPPEDLDTLAQKELGFKSTKTYDTLSEGVTQNDSVAFNTIVDKRVKESIKLGAADWAKSVGVDLSPDSLSFADTFQLPGGFKGSYFESVLDAFQGRPIGAEAAEANRPFDFTRGLKPMGTLFDQLAAKNVQYIDAKISGGANINEAQYGKKITNQLALDLIEDPAFTQQINAMSKQRIAQQNPTKKHFGGIIQAFAFGGRAKGIQGAPLVDDILQASGSILPRPSAAIQALIKAGGGAVDVDRTLKRTVGDTAYAKAPTPGAKDATLNTYFRDEVKRLQDLKSAPITQFGQELKDAIKSGQLDPRKISIISKSKRVKGAAEYLSSQFGIPVQNMIFTQGASKQPALDAIRNKGSRVDRVARFATGGNVGTDTVPALLTPGEFVVNKASAQRIGYGNLHRMNTVGKYAKGGIVQHFAQGGAAGVQAPSMVGTGGTGPGQNFVPLTMLTKQAQTLAQAQQAQTQATQQATQTTQNNTQAVQQNGLSFMAATIGLGAIQSAFAALTPVIDKNSTAFEKVTASVLNSVSSLVNTLGIAIIALQQLNIQITLATTKMIAQNAFDFLSGAKSLTQIFDIAKNGIPGMQNFTKSFKSALAGIPRNIPTRAIGTAAGNVTRAGNFAGTVANKASGLLSSARAGLNSSSVAQSINNNQTSNIITSAFKGGTQNKAGLFSAVKSGAVGQNPFVNMPGIAGTKATLTSMSNATGTEKFISKISGKTGQFFGDLSKGFSAGKSGTSFQTVKSLQPFSNMSGVMGKTAQAAMPGAVSNAAVGSFGKAIGTMVRDLNAAAGPLLAIQVATSLASGAINSFFDYQNQANAAIQEGNAAKASENSVNAAAQDSIDSFGSSAILAGAAIGSIIPGVGTLVGGLAGAAVALGTKFLPSIEKAIFGTDYVNQAFIGLGTVFGGNTYDSIKSLAVAQAEGVKAQKALTEAGERVTTAMNDLQSGTISAAQAVASNAAQASQVGKSVEANKKASADNDKNKSGVGSAMLREVGAYATFGYVDTADDRNKRIDTENKARSQESTKMQEDLISKSTPAINAFSADIAAAGGSFQDVLASMNDSTSAAFNPALYQALIQQGTGPLQKAFDNIKKEVERAQKAFNAMNLGMQNVQGAAAAAALGVNNYVASQQAGNIGLEQSLAVLEASVTSAAQGISDADFGKALNDAESTLRGFGANDEQVNKFKGNISSVNEVQKNQKSIFASAKDQLAADIRKSNSADQRKQIFSQSIDNQLKAAGYDDKTRQRFKDATGNMSDEQLKKIGEGDFTAFEESINELGKKTMEQVSGPLKAAIEIQKQLNELTKQRIEAERQLMNAQLEASNVRMEAMDIAAKYGGPKVTPEMRAQNTVEQANIQARGIKGVTDLKTGSATELSTRNQQLSRRQSEIAQIKMNAARGDSAAQQQLQGESGIKLADEEKKLQEAAKSQIQATRDLIKSKEEELKIIKEKNQLERSSIDALVSGDIEKFFDQQAAVGAQAAVATGDQRLIGQFGMGALGDAAKETRRQQEAGVQELYGQKLSGPGGLTERAYGSAISAAGIQNPLAMAQVAAGSTGAEAAVESDIRDLAATMGPTADIQSQAAQDQLTAAQMQIDAARAKGEEAVAQMQARQMATGGIVYASRGIFVPRGTDTVPAMLTPGEFVVRREAVQRNNNLSILQAMNKGVSASAPAASSQSGDVAAMATGGIVRYRSGGSTGPESGSVGISTEALNAFAAALSQFNTELTKNIKTLSDTKFQITLSPTNINVNLTGTSFLANLTASIKQDLLKFLGQEISNYSVGNDGKLRKTGSTLGTIT